MAFVATVESGCAIAVVFSGRGGTKGFNRQAELLESASIEAGTCDFFATSKGVVLGDVVALGFLLHRRF